MMPRPAHRVLFAIASVALGAAAMGQVSIQPPEPAAAPPNAAPATPVFAPTQPASTPRASTLPSAASVLQGIMQDKPAESGFSASKEPINTMAQPVIAGVAPNQPPAVLLREGDSIDNRTGRLTRDEKTGNLVFVFDSDGKRMTDPPMGVIPCRYLALMEDKSEHGTNPVKFRISAEITEYHGKNYIYPKMVTVVLDLNQGIGAGGQTPVKTTPANPH
jgi:hypothetical protein